MIRQFIKAWERVKEVRSSDGKILIRGAGDNGRMLLYDLTVLDVKVSAFIDANPALAGGEVNGVPVISPDEVYTLATGSYFILSSVGSNDAYAELRLEMEDYGLSEGRDFADFGLNCDWRMYSDGVGFRYVEPASYDRHELNILECNEMKEQYFIRDDFEPTRDCFIAHLDFIVTTRCSLRCVGCSNLISERSKPMHFDPEAIVSDLDKLLSVSQVGALLILGGEALLHPRLADILRMIGQMEHRDNLGGITCFTNATVTPSETLLDALSLVGVGVRISDYGARSPHAEYISRACEEAHIPMIRITHPKWTDLGDFRTKRNRSADDLRRLYNVCKVSLCYQLYDGRLYGCSRASVLYGEGLVPADPNPFVYIRNLPRKELEETLRRYLNDTPYLSACDYCDGMYPGSKEIPRARQL